MNCLNPLCNRPTNNPKFCSRSCAAIISNQTPKRKLTTKCKYCDSIVRSYRSTMCELHYQEYKSSTAQAIYDTPIGQYRNRDSVKDLHVSSKHAHVRGLARIRNKELTELPCALCGYDKHVEICHIKPMSSFPDDTLVSEVNDKQNLIQLCPNCHWEFDHGLVSMPAGI